MSLLLFKLCMTLSSWFYRDFIDAQHISTGAQVMRQSLRVTCLQAKTMLRLAHDVPPMCAPFQTCTGWLPIMQGAEAILLEELAPDSLLSLMATSKHLHHVVNSSLSSVRIRSSKYVMPLMERLDTRPNLTCLNLSGAGIDEQHIELIAQGHLSALQKLDLSCNELGSPAAQQLVQASWPSLTSLSLSAAFTTSKVVDWPQRDESIVAACSFLATGNWPQLLSLDVSCNALSPAAWSELVKADWSKLQTLNISHSMKAGIDSSMQHLATARLPSLNSVDLSGNDLAHCCHHLVQAEWPQLSHLVVGDFWGINQALPQAGSFWQRIRRLTVKGAYQRRVHDEVAKLVRDAGQALDMLHVECEVKCAAEEIPLQSSWPPDTKLDVALSLDVAVVQGLAAGYWPIRSLELMLYSTGLNMAAMEELICLDLPKLESLSLVSNRALPEAVCLSITKADWPALERVHLEGVNDGHVSLLTAGVWPLLGCISLTGSNLSPHSLAQLVKGNWPFLAQILLPSSCVGLTANVQALSAKWPLIKFQTAAGCN